METDDNQFLQAVLLATKGGSGFSSARLLALPAFLASAIGAKNVLSKIFGLDHVDETYGDALKWWFGLRKIGMSPKNKTKKIGQGQVLTAKLRTLIYDSNQRT